jgi:ABC-type branched-subunit amino acid transport system substrate-binding protein
MTQSIKFAILIPDRHNPGVMDQALGARLAALQSGLGIPIIAEEVTFRPEDSVDLERRLARLRGKISGVIGATNVLESTLLGELAEDLRLLCFVANNNPSVWNGKRHIFHIGIPSAQTAEAVALGLARLGIRRVQLVHDQTEFQRRAGASALAALHRSGMEARSQAGEPASETEKKSDWAAELFYLLYSDEEKALAVAQAIRRQTGETPLLFGRSLLRRSFISALGEDTKEAWFVDLLPRTGSRSPIQDELIGALAKAGAQIPTANQCFGWDAMTLSGMALAQAKGDCESAIDYLESGVVLEGVAGNYRFDATNHNGRSDIGPTVLSRWRKDHIEEIVAKG